jgi:riboflavin kinase / FMN adenylyltransferase
MRLYRGLHNLESFNAGCVATIGNFDGVHQGHVSILQRLKKLAEKHVLPSTVIFFEPLPAEFFRPEQAPVRIMSFREKFSALKAFGIERVVCLRFNTKLASMPAQNFVNEFLINQLGVKHLIVGDDFKFGHKRQGDFELLQQMGVAHAFKVENSSTIRLEKERISSSRVRQALASNDLAQVEQLLGRPMALTSHVYHGDKLGRKLSFPTANLNWRRKKAPLHGVYAVTATIAGKRFFGVANCGTRPTIDGPQDRVEVHLFDFNQEIYSQLIHVEFVGFVRKEQKFESLDALKAQIALDCIEAKQILSQYC